VRPELVAEIAFNEIQASPHYPGGFALRFARVKRYREDKSARDADTIETVRALYQGQLHRRASEKLRLKGVPVSLTSCSLRVRVFPTRASGSRDSSPSGALSRVSFHSDQNPGQHGNQSLVKRGARSRVSKTVTKTMSR